MHTYTITHTYSKEDDEEATFRTQNSETNRKMNRLKNIISVCGHIWLVKFLEGSET